MRLITFMREGKPRLGAWTEADTLIVDLASASTISDDATNPDFATMQSLIEGGDVALDHARKLVDNPPEAAVLESANYRLLAPIPQPVQIRDCLCFPDHLLGARKITAETAIANAPDPTAKRAELEAAGQFELPQSYYDFPLYYVSNRMSVIGPDTDVVWPSFSSFIDFELEWAAVLGRSGQCIPGDEARSHLFGYTIFNDWSARDEQARVMTGAINLGPSSGKDFSNGIGPCIVTADELADPYNLTMIARVNGEEVARGSTGGMYYKFEDLIAHISRGHAIYAGEMLCSGTVGGGCAFEAGITLKHRDVVELEMEGIGCLRNRVHAPHVDGTSGDDTVLDMGQIMKR